MSIDKEIETRLHNCFFTHTDINEHYPVIHFLASQCESIVELGGIREFETSWLLALARPKKFTTVDADASVSSRPALSELTEFCQRAGIEYSHVNDDTRMVDIEDTDLLFTDSIHTAEFIKSELLSHAPFIRKFIIIHDTAIFGEYGEHGSFVNGEYRRVPGLRVGINEFLEVDNSWKKVYEYGHNNGLTILAKVS